MQVLVRPEGLVGVFLQYRLPRQIFSRALKDVVILVRSLFSTSSHLALWVLVPSVGTECATRKNVSFVSPPNCAGSVRNLRAPEPAPLGYRSLLRPGRRFGGRRG